MPLRPVGDRFIVDPYYEGKDTKIGSIIIPDSMAEVEPSQGVVIAAPEKYKELEGAYVVFHRFRYKALQGTDHICLEEKDLVCRLDEYGGIHLFEHRNEYLILPDWESKYGQKSDLIFLPPIAQEHGEPVLFGRIVKTWGTTDYLDSAIKVVIEPQKGCELAVKNTLYYIISSEHILAIIHHEH